MAILFMDSFDHYATSQISQKWHQAGDPSYVTINATGGRRGGGCMQLYHTDSVVSIAIPGSTTVFLGFAYKISTLSGGIYTWCFMEISSENVQFKINTDGSITAYRYGTSLGSSAAGVLTTNTWYYIEIKVVISNTVGEVVVRVNGTTVINLTNVDTWYDVASGSVGLVDRINMQYPGAYSNYAYIDDLIVYDGNSPNNSFMGDIQVRSYRPNANGNSSGWSGSDGNSTDNYALVNETTPDDDTTYVQTNSANAKDTYNFPALGFTADAIKGVQILTRMEKTGTTPRGIAHVTRSNSTDYDSSTIYVPSSYAPQITARDVDPNTSAAWTQANLEAAEFGVKLIA